MRMHAHDVFAETGQLQLHAGARGRLGVDQAPHAGSIQCRPLHHYAMDNNTCQVTFELTKWMFARARLIEACAHRKVRQPRPCCNCSSAPVSRRPGQVRAGLGRQAGVVALGSNCQRFDVKALSDPSYCHFICCAWQSSCQCFASVRSWGRLQENNRHKGAYALVRWSCRL